MDLITNLWNNWSSYEKLLMGILVLIILLIVPLIVWVFTKDRKFAFVSTLSIIISGVIVSLTLIIARQFFTVLVTDIYKVVPFITIFVVILSIGTVVGYYMQNHKRRDFTFADLHNEIKNDNIRLSLSILFMLLALAILTPSLLLPLLFALGDALAALWLSYLLIKRIIR